MGCAATRAPRGASASFTALSTAPGAPAVPASPAPLKPPSAWAVGVSTCPTTMSLHDGAPDLLWQRLLGRPASESGRLRHGEKILGWGRPPPEDAKVAYAPGLASSQPVPGGCHHVA